YPARPGDRTARGDHPLPGHTRRRARAGPAHRVRRVHGRGAGDDGSDIAAAASQDARRYLALDASTAVGQATSSGAPEAAQKRSWASARPWFNAPSTADAGRLTNAHPLVPVSEKSAASTPVTAAVIVTRSMGPPGLGLSKVAVPATCTVGETPGDESTAR